MGAGPGDPDLLTIKAVRLIQTRGRGPARRPGSAGDSRTTLAPAEIVNVGKRCGIKTITQEEINALMIEHARAGRSVVRLKSGDPLIFGRAAEEMAALTEAGVLFEVVPGITAAFAAAAAIGCSLTDRNSASNVVFSTGHHAQSHNQSPCLRRRTQPALSICRAAISRCSPPEWLDAGPSAGVPLRRRLPRRTARPASAMYDPRRPRRSTNPRSRPACSSPAGRSVRPPRLLQWHTTGFTSQHKLQIRVWRTIMSEPNGAPARRAISLDIYAVALSLILALLVRFNLIPPVKW